MSVMKFTNLTVRARQSLQSPLPCPHNVPSWPDNKPAKPIKIPRLDPGATEKRGGRPNMGRLGAEEGEPSGTFLVENDIDRHPPDKLQREREGAGKRDR